MKLLPIIRAIPPQETSAPGTRAFVLACNPEDVAGVSFCIYGFVRYTTLDWIKDTLAMPTRPARLDEP
jgi:hypothetical protein